MRRWPRRDRQRGGMSQVTGVHRPEPGVCRRRLGCGWRWACRQSHAGPWPWHPRAGRGGRIVGMPSADQRVSTIMLFRTARPYLRGAIASVAASVVVTVLVAIWLWRYSCYVGSPQTEAVSAVDVIASPITYESWHAIGASYTHMHEESLLAVLQRLPTTCPSHRGGVASQADIPVLLLQQESVGLPLQWLCSRSQLDLSTGRLQSEMRRTSRMRRISIDQGNSIQVAIGVPSTVKPLYLATSLVVNAVIIWCTAALASLGWRVVLRVSRHRRGACLCCGYDLAGLGGNGGVACPECGVAARSNV